MSDDHGQLQQFRTFLLLTDPGTRVLQQFVSTFYTRRGCTNLKDFLHRNYHKLYRLHNRTGYCPCGNRGVAANPPVLRTPEWDRLFQNDPTTPCKTRPRDTLTEQELDIRLCCLLVNNIGLVGTDIADEENNALDIVRTHRNKLVHGEINFEQLTVNEFFELWRKIRDAILILAVSSSQELSSDISNKIIEIQQKGFPDEERQNLKTQVNNFIFVHLLDMIDEFEIVQV